MILDNKHVHSLYLFWMFGLTFCSGFLNALGILYIGYPVSHYTGSLAKIAIYLEEFHFVDFFPIVGLILSYFVGCILAGFLTQGKEFSLSKRYGIILITVAAYLCFHHYFLCEYKFFFYSLAVIMGLQNGLFISYRGLVIRTTHITGNLTDAGVFLGRVVHGRHEDVWKIFFYLVNMLAFFLGCYFGTQRFQAVESRAFLEIASFYAFEGLVYFFVRVLHHC